MVPLPITRKRRKEIEELTSYLHNHAFKYTLTDPSFDPCRGRLSLDIILSVELQLLLLLLCITTSLCCRHHTYNVPYTASPSPLPHPSIPSHPIPAVDTGRGVPSAAGVRICFKTRGRGSGGGGGPSCGGTSVTHVVPRREGQGGGQGFEAIRVQVSGAKRSEAELSSGAASP